MEEKARHRLVEVTGGEGEMSTPQVPGAEAEVVEEYGREVEGLVWGAVQRVVQREECLPPTLLQGWLLPLPLPCLLLPVPVPPPPPPGMLRRRPRPIVVRRAHPVWKRWEVEAWKEEAAS